MRRRFNILMIIFLFLIITQAYSQQEFLIDDPFTAPPSLEAPVNNTAATSDRDQKISLDLKGIEIADLLKILSQKTASNIVPSKAVAGRVNIYLNEVTFADALDIILVSNDLASEKKGGIIYVMTADEYLRTYGQRYNEKRQILSFKLLFAKPKDIFSALENLKSEIGRIIVDEPSATVILLDIPEKLSVMHQKALELDRPPAAEVFDLKYAKAADLKNQITPALTEGVGTISVDERTNRIMVTDLPDKMKKIKQMVKAFDAAHNQVFIEGEIVEITLDKKFERGINWEKIFNSLDHFNFKGVFPVSPALSSYGQISVGTLATDHYNATFQLLRTYGDVKTISRPRIAAIDNAEAKIIVGTRKPYTTSTVSQGSSSTTVTAENVEFIETGVKLSVTPQVNKDGFVTMKIRPEVSSADTSVETPSHNKIPIVQTSEAETTVKVKDGTMIMIAGLMKEEKVDNRLDVPGLSAIPFIGPLFGSKTKQGKKTELIIFITPHIMTGESSYIGPSGEKNTDIPKTPTASDRVKDKLKGLAQDEDEK